MELSIPPPNAPPNTPAVSVPTTPGGNTPGCDTPAEANVEAKESFKVPVEEIIKGLDDVIAAQRSGGQSQANPADATRKPPERVLGDAKKIISGLYKRIDELEASVSILQTWNKKLSTENGEMRLREAQALKLLKTSEGEKAVLERQVSLQTRESKELDDAMEKTLRDLMTIS